MPITKASPHKGLKAAGAPVMFKSDHDTHFVYHCKKDLFVILMMKEPKFAKGS